MLFGKEFQNFGYTVAYLKERDMAAWMNLGC